MYDNCELKVKHYVIMHFGWYVRSILLLSNILLNLPSRLIITLMGFVAFNPLDCKSLPLESENLKLLKKTHFWNLFLSTLLVLHGRLSTLG
jgi:hypothetical protein